MTRWHLTTLFASLLALSRITLASEPHSVLMIVADDLGWGDLGAHGNREVDTPHLDSLIDRGMSLEKYHSCPTGAATLASLLTGRYHYRTGVAGDTYPESTMYGSEVTLAERYRASGYRTAYFGTWSLGENWPQNATGQGFDLFLEEMTSSQPITDWISNNGDDDAPFFALARLPMPKLTDAEPLSAEKRLELVKESIATLDRWIGEISAVLGDDTLLIFTSDNGPDQYGDTEGRYNGYLYGGRGSVHEGGVRVPCIAVWPAVVPAGSRFDRITTAADWYPTLAELGSLTPPERQLPTDGLSLAPALHLGEKPEQWPNRVLFTSWTPPGYDLKGASVAVRTDRWVALRDARWARQPEAIADRSGWELYDLKNDPFQRIDKADEFPFLLSELRADYTFWMDHTTDDGVGPIATHVGHEEWPVVEINRSGRLRVIRPGTYQLKTVSDRPAQIKLGDETLQITSKGVQVELQEKHDHIAVGAPIMITSLEAE